MFNHKKQKAHGRIDSLIGLETTVRGHLDFSGGLRIDGQVVGDVSARDGKVPGTLVLSEKARIEGCVRVAHQVLNGTVVGPIYSSKYLELQSKSRIQGDVYYHTLEIRPGAVVEGKLVHVSDAAAAPATSEPAAG